jgi:hypothetical protein
VSAFLGDQICCALTLFWNGGPLLNLSAAAIFLAFEFVTNFYKTNISEVMWPLGVILRVDPDKI